MAVRKHILVIAEDSAVRQTKQLILENMGHSVLAVKSVRELEYATSRSVFDLAILGRTVSVPHKQAAAKTFKARLPNVPILEICDISPCVDRPDYVLRSANPEELTSIVSAIFNVEAQSTGK
jgi:DNA-binding NtrC family response regulator